MFSYTRFRLPKPKLRLYLGSGEARRAELLVLGLDERRRREFLVLGSVERRRRELGSAIVSPFYFALTFLGLVLGYSLGYSFI